MNRTFLPVAVVCSGSGLLVADSAVKGAALLASAAIAAMILRRDSAATRHFVWLLAMVALLAVPALSAILPQWRVLPEWAGIGVQAVVAESDPPPTHEPPDHVIDLPQRAESVQIEAGAAASDRPVAELPVTRRASMTPAIIPTSADRNRGWVDALPMIWAIGFMVLILRIGAARWLLRNSERRATGVCLTAGSGPATSDPLAKALEAARAQLGISRPIALLIHPDKTIPVVWGIFRVRLMLPAEAKCWSGEQLRSVLLHELAHVKRHDAVAQLLTQFACALHWFNPLVWFAAARLGVERERACDDLVLASGVRPSVYAGHLLQIVTGLSPARGTLTCGLAMARKSSLESRLVAVLSETLNRRSVSTALAATSLAIAIGVAVPVAMLGATAAQPAEKAAGKAKPSDDERTAMKPKHEYAQSLFAKWQANARTDGRIPGALIGQVAHEIDGFLKQYPQDEKTPPLAALRPRLDATHDWKQADVVALLDDITAISTAPVSWADIAMNFDGMRDLKRGQPLRAELTSAAWGPPAANGLCTAWLLEPRADPYALGTVLKSRVLFRNTGQKPVVFRTETWHQYDSHIANDAKGGKTTVSGTRYSGITPTAEYRLGPGEYCEVAGHGIAIGAGKYEDEFSTGSVGAVIEAKQGDDVVLSHEVDTAEGGWTRPNDPKDPADLRKKVIAERVAREAPMPQAAADREQLIRRVTLDIVAEMPSAAEVAAFVADNAPDALAKLTERLQATPVIEPFAGKLTTGETKFRVTAADPDAGKRPQAANSPGRYVLGDSVRLLVSQTTTESQRTNKAIIAFLSLDPKVASPHKPYEISLPDGLRTWGAAWQRGAGELWVMQKGLVRKYDFGNPDHVKEERFEPGAINDVPANLREALTQAFNAAGATKSDTVPGNPQPKDK